jgi:hypothetical protein
VVAELGSDSPLPGFVEAHARNLGEHVDSDRRDPDVQPDSGGGQILFGHALQRRAELPKCIDDPDGVLGGCFDPNVEIHRRARAPVHAERVGTDDEELHLIGEKR